MQLALSILILTVALPAASKSIQVIRNEKVTAYDIVLQPAEAASPAHSPGVLVFYQPGSYDLETGTSERAMAKRGDIRYVGANAWTMRNAGVADLHYVLVLFAASASQETWGSSGLAPHYTPLTENPYTRVYDIRIPAHTNEPQHTHHDRVVVCLSGAKLEHLYPDGRKEPSTLSTGEIAWRRGATHIGQNLGDTDLWVIAIEPK